MKTILPKLLILILIGLHATICHGQTNAGNTINNEKSPALSGDTLYLGDGQKIFIGQKLKVGEPSGRNGHFRSIISKRAAIVPSIWGQDKRYENAIENYVDSKKSKEKLRLFLLSAKSLMINKITMPKSGKPYFYMVFLSSDSDECKADIQLALKLKELVL